MFKCIFSRIILLKMVQIKLGVFEFVLLIIFVMNCILIRYNGLYIICKGLKKKKKLVFYVRQFENNNCIKKKKCWKV